MKRNSRTVHFGVASLSTERQAHRAPTFLWTSASTVTQL